jgi:hypothetical protein
LIPLKQQDLQPWLRSAYTDIILPKRKIIENHPLVKSMQAGASEKQDARVYFEGLLWHLLDFGKHVSYLMAKRPPEVLTFLGDRAEDEDGDTQILGRIINAFGGNFEKIAKSPWNQRVNPIWIHHDALLRSAIYSEDYKIGRHDQIYRGGTPGGHSPAQAL